MTLPILCVPPGDAASSTLAASYSHASQTTITVQSGEIGRFGSPSATAPVRLRLVKQSQLSGGVWALSDPAATAVYRCTGVSGSTLTGLAFESGTNQDFASGDLVAVTINARDITDLQAHIHSGVVNVLSFGTVAGDGTTDDGPAVQAIIAAHPGRSIYLPGRGTGDGVPPALPSYYLGTTTLTLTAPGTTLYGDGGGYTGGTVLHWAAGIPGITVVGTSYGSVVRDLCLAGSERWDGVFYDQGIVPAGRAPGLTAAAGASESDGVRVGSAYTRLSNLTAVGFGRDGINVSAQDQGLPSGEGGEDCLFDRIFCGNNRGHGIRVQGGDSNCNQFNAPVVFVNQYWGIDNEAFLAGSFISPQATQNGFDNSQNISANPPPPTAVTLTRSGNVVTAVFASAMFRDTASSTPLAPGDGICVQAATTGNFIGRWRILTVSGDNKTFTYTQVASNASATGTAIASYLPPDYTITSAVRATGVVTLVSSSAMLAASDSYTAVHAAPMRVGQGISVLNCPDASFNGTFVVLSVSSDHKTVTYNQVGSNASIASGTARMAIPLDVWTATGIRGGSYLSNSATAPTVWVNPYAEGGQACAFSSACVVIAPVWSDNPSLTWTNPDGSSGSGLPLIVYGEVPGVGAGGANQPLSTVRPFDVGATATTILGVTAPQTLYESYCSPVFTSNAFPVIWQWQTGADDVILVQGDPNQAGSVQRLRFSITSGYTYLNSSGGGTIRVNADASTGTGGVLFGDGTGGASTTTINGGTVHATGTVRTGAGATGARPAGVAAGSQWYDTTLAKPIWYDGAAWRDAAGTVV